MNERTILSMIADVTDCLAPSGCDFDQVLLSNYDGLFRFGLTLTGSPDTAHDLTQQTIYLALKSEGQLREPRKARSWLFTILYRAFLQTRRHQTRFPHHTLDETAHESPGVEPETVERLDSAIVAASARRPVRRNYFLGRAPDVQTPQDNATPTRLPN